MTGLRSFFRLVLGLCFSMGCLGEPGLALNLGSSESVSWQAHVFSGTRCATAMTCNHLADVNGDNEPDVFRSYVEGPISLSHAMADGVYDVTLLFAEPRVTNVGERLFNVILQNEVVLENIDGESVCIDSSVSCSSITILNSLSRSCYLGPISCCIIWP